MTKPSILLNEILSEICLTEDEDQENVTRIAMNSIRGKSFSEVIEAHSFSVKLLRAFENALFGGIVG